MRFVIVKSTSTGDANHGLMAIDNADIAIDTSGLAANIEMIVYQEVNGKIQYNDRPSVRDSFTDPSPYQSFINLWLTAYSTATPPLTLDQAKFVKCDFVEGIYHSKRRAPFASGGHTYDGNDEAVQYLTATVGGGVTVSSVNAALAALTSSVNNQVITPVNNNVSANNSSAASVNTWSSKMHDNSRNTGRYIGSAAPWQVGAIAALIGEATLQPSTGTGSGTGYGGFLNHSALSGISPPTVSGGGGGASDTAPWQPLDATSILTIPTSDLNAALQGMTTRRNNLNAMRVSKKAAINALTTIAQVIAYDATSGWPTSFELN